MVPSRTKYKPPPQAVVIDYLPNGHQWCKLCEPG